MDERTMRATIEEYVKEERDRREMLRVDTSYKNELSGEAFNEFAMLLDRQLLTTAIGYGGWLELEDDAVLEGVYRLVAQRSVRP